MMNTAAKLLASLALCAVVTTGTAFARDHDRDRDKASPARHHVVRDHDRDHDRDRARDRRQYFRRHRDRDRRHDRQQDALYGNNGQPNGWTQGHKQGWRNCDMPPGQAKKYGCSSTWNGAHRRHDRDRDGDRD